MSEAPNLNADLKSHHIDGYARAAVEQGLDGYFKTDLISHIEGNLWTGGCLPNVTLPDDFRYVVSLYKWEKYHLPADCQRIEVEMYDAGEIPDVPFLFALAQAVNIFRKEGKTLVHCQAGLNRSSLVTSLALIIDGMPPPEAIALLREKRSPLVLCNVAFEKWLLAY